MKNVLCIGTGKTGKAIIHSLSEKKDIENIYIKNSSSTNPFSHEKEDLIQLLPKIYKKKIDTVILVHSGMPTQDRTRLYNTCQTTEEFRTIEWNYNKTSIEEYIPFLQTLFHSKIIVVTNPVDTVVNFLNTKLNRTDIIGYGMTLDRKRIQTSSAYKTHRELFPKNTPLAIWGKHGYPLPIIDSTREFYEELFLEVDHTTLTQVRSTGINTDLIYQDFSDFITTLSSPTPTLVDLCHHQNILKECPNMALSGQFLVQNMNIIKAIPPQLNRDESLLLTEIGRSIQAPLNRSAKEPL